MPQAALSEMNSRENTGQGLLSFDCKLSAVCFNKNHTFFACMFAVCALPYAHAFVCLHTQIEYFLRKLTEAMGGSWVEERFEDYKLQLNCKQQCLNAWELIILVGSGHFSKGMDIQTLSMGISEVYQELILDVLKQVRSTKHNIMRELYARLFLDWEQLPGNQ